MRFQFTTLLAASAALAAPMPNELETTQPELFARYPATGQNNPSCDGYRDAFWDVNQSAFKVTIGRPYLGGGRCPELRAKVSKHFHVKSFKCSGALKNQKTVITMTSNMDASNLANVNKGLKAAYPELSFSCPNMPSAVSSS